MNHDSIPDAEPRRSLKVLVIEDDRDTAESTAILLETAGHSASMAVRNLEVVQSLAIKSYDVIILDLALHGMSGFDVLNWIRESGSSEPPEVIVVSGYASAEIRHEASMAGVRHFLVKPADPIVLIDLVNGICASIPTAIAAG